LRKKESEEVQDKLRLDAIQDARSELADFTMDQKKATLERRREESMLAITTQLKDAREESDVLRSTVTALTDELEKTKEMIQERNAWDTKVLTLT